jgi:thiamine kinase-like enzyme
MTSNGRTPNRSSRTQRSPAHPQALTDLLRELNIRTGGRPRFKLVSKWAAKHVWRIDINGEPWGFIRYLLGPADQFPERWRHLEMGQLLYDAHVGPRVLGITPASDALGGRAAIIESALVPITRDDLEARGSEAIALFTRLHSDPALLEALSENLTEADQRGFSPLERFLAETQERWFDAVVGRWLEVGLEEINIVRQVVSEVMGQLEEMQSQSERINIIVPAHNDPNHGNFMVNRQGALRMIDFEELALSNPVADLGVFLTWYADVDQHYTLLKQYPLADADAMLDRMKVWVPLRYLSIAAHWAARLTRAEDEPAWVFAAESVDEWLRGACELTSGGTVPPHQKRRLEHLRERLLARWPSVKRDAEYED